MSKLKVLASMLCLCTILITPITSFASTSVQPETTVSTEFELPIKAAAVITYYFKSNIGTLTVLNSTLVSANHGDTLHVKIVQAALKAIGYKGADGKVLAVDGIWGPNTTYAVLELQRDTYSTADGIVGPNTWYHLYRLTYNDGIKF